MAALGGKIYAVGGIDDGDNYLSSAEAFDPQTNCWAAVAPMSTARCDLSVAVVGGKLHAVGGKYADRTTIASVEAYNRQHDRWDSVAPMSEAHKEAATVCV